MISDVFHVIYDALLQIIARLEIDISAAAVARMLDLRIIPAVFLARRVPQALDDQHDQRRKVCLFISVSFFSTQSALCIFMMQIAAAITLGCYFPSFAIAVSIFSCSCFMLFSFVMPPSTGSPTIFPFRSIT